MNDRKLHEIFKRDLWLIRINLYFCNIEYSVFIKIACDTRSFFKLFKLLKGFLYNLLNMFLLENWLLENWKSLYIKNKYRFEKS